VRFRSLGSHRLRGLRDPVALYQVEAAGLIARFRPLRTEAAGPAQTANR
jgi:class 3 adenylate cyclase